MALFIFTNQVLFSLLWKSPHITFPYFVLSRLQKTVFRWLQKTVFRCCLPVSWQNIHFVNYNPMMTSAIVISTLIPRPTNCLPIERWPYKCKIINRNLLRLVLTSHDIGACSGSHGMISIADTPHVLRHTVLSPLPLLLQINYHIHRSALAVSLWSQSRVRTRAEKLVIFNRDIITLPNPKLVLIISNR